MAAATAGTQCQGPFAAVCDAAADFAVAAEVVEAVDTDCRQVAGKVESASSAGAQVLVAAALQAAQTVVAHAVAPAVALVAASAETL